jgi:hypothetical protein
VVLLSGFLLAGCTQIAGMFSVWTPAMAREAVARLSPFGVINSYGLFATMTTERIEIEVQGSDDGEVWKTYSFRYKPGDPGRAPPWVAPHQPRLDWQMWFAALGSYNENPWFSNFMVRLLSASPDVLALLESDPFAGKRPKYLRALAYDYRFSNIQKRAAAKIWWQRTPKGTYFPQVSLRSP